MQELCVRLNCAHGFVFEGQGNAAHAGTSNERCFIVVDLVVDSYRKCRSVEKRIPVSLPLIQRNNSTALKHPQQVIGQ
jgi:hypothetical protein